MLNNKFLSNITYFKFRDVIFICVFGLFLNGCDDTPNFEGDKIIGTWVVYKRINWIDDSVEEFDISEMIDKVTFFTSGKFKSISENNSSSGEWRNLGDGNYRFSNDGGLVEWSRTTAVEFIGDNQMNYVPPYGPVLLGYYIKIE